MPCASGCSPTDTSRRRRASGSPEALARGIQEQAATAAQPLAGRRVVVSAGGTREPLDPVRFLGNRSSGKQGYALAAVAAARGAEVLLVSANADLPVPAGCHRRAGQHGPGDARSRPQRGQGGRRGGDGRGRGRLPPGGVRVEQDQEVARPRPARCRAHGRARPQPRHPRRAGRPPAATRPRPSSWALPQRPATTRDRCSSTAGPSSPARGATCWSSTRSESAAPSARTTTPSTSCDRARSHVVDAGPASKEEIAAVVWDAVQQIL